MKKVLSFVLVLAMILGCTSMAFAGATSTATKAAVPFPDAQDNMVATILKDLGVLIGDEKGNANLDKTISRAEFCTILLRALGRESVAKTSADPKPFTDFKKADWFSGYVMAAYNEKIADGVSKTAFDPLGTVTADQAVTFVVKALGYDAAHVTGTWPLNYRIIASDLGLLPEDFDFENEEITRGEVFKVLFAALDKPLVIWDAKAEEFKNATVAVGAYATMTKRLGGTTLGGLYTVDNAAVVIGGPADPTFDNKFEPAGLDGQYVTLLKKNNGNGNIGIAKVLSEPLEGTYDKAGYTTFAGLKVNQNATGVAFVNGGLTDTAIGLTTKTAVTAQVEKDAKTVTIYSISYEYKNASAFVTTKEAVKLASGVSTAAISGFAFEVSGNAIKEGSYTLVGADTLADVEGDAYVDIYLNAATGKIAKLVVTQNQVVGKVTKVQTKAGYKYVTVDGTAYKYASKNENEVQVVAPNYTSEFALTLNADGNVVKFALYDPAEAEVKDVWYYAFVLNTGKTPAKSTAAEWAGQSPVVEATKYAISFVDFADDEAQVVDVATKAACLNGDNWAVASGAVIKYTLDDAGEITKITNAATDFTSFGAMKTMTPNALGIGSYRYASDVKIVAVDTAKGATNAAAYAAKTTADLSGKGWTPVYYHLNTDKKIDMVVVKGTGVPGSEYTYLTGAAVTAYWNESKASYASILFNGEEEDYDVIGSVPVTTTLALQVVTLKSGKVETVAPLTTSIAAYTTTKGLTCDDSNVFVTGEALAYDGTKTFFGLDDEIVIYAFCEDDAIFEVYEDTLEEALKAYETVVFYDLDADGFVDTVVLK